MVVVLVRVETGVSYDNNTLKTAMSLNTGDPELVQRAPFTLNFTKPEVGPSDLTNDAYSGSPYAQNDPASGPPDSEIVLKNLNYSSVTSVTTTSYLGRN